MRTPIRGWMVVMLLVSVVGYAIAEDLTLTTYYPSPRGVYQELRTQDSLVVGGVSHGPDGGALPAARLLVAGAGDPVVYGTLDPCPAGTAWFDDNPTSGRDAYECRPPVIITPAGQVGIGTTSPDSGALLDVAGKITLSSPDPAQRTITNLTAPVDPTDAATREWVLAQAGGAGLKLVKNFASTSSVSVDCGAGWSIVRCAYGYAPSVDWAAKGAAAVMWHGLAGGQCLALTLGGHNATGCACSDWDQIGGQTATVSISGSVGTALIALCAKQ